MFVNVHFLWKQGGDRFISFLLMKEMLSVSPAHRVWSSLPLGEPANQGPLRWGTTWGCLRPERTSEAGAPQGSQVTLVLHPTMPSLKTSPACCRGHPRPGEGPVAEEEEGLAGLHLPEVRGGLRVPCPGASCPARTAMPPALEKLWLQAIPHAPLCPRGVPHIGLCCWRTGEPFKDFAILYLPPHLHPKRHPRKPVRAACLGGLKQHSNSITQTAAGQAGEGWYPSILRRSSADTRGARVRHTDPLSSPASARAGRGRHSCHGGFCARPASRTQLHP